MNGTVVLPWGGGSLELRLPEQWIVLGELKPRSSAAPVDIAQACAEALQEPIGAKPFGARQLTGQRIVIVVDDHSRPTPVSEFIRPVVEVLGSAGVRDEQVEFLIATGVHRSSRPEEIEWKLGREILSRFRCRCHDAYDPEALAYMGTTSRGTRVLLNKLLTEADLIICVGALEPHLLLGFGGGLKMIIPGCAAAETVGRNHLQGIDPEHFNYVGTRGDDSPMRLDLEEGAGLLGKEIFVINAVINEHGRPTRFFCGDPVQAHRSGESFVENLLRLDIPEQADVVVTNSFPMDLDLRQSAKCLGNTLYACKPGGTMMGFLRCEQGLGEIPLAKKTLPYPVTRMLLKVLGKKRILPLVEKARKGEPVEEVFMGHFGLQMLRRNHLAIFSDSQKLPQNLGRKMGLAQSFTDIGEMLSWISAKVPRNARAWIFPNGGTTYARLNSAGV
jgi:nickel-dependent lactate racemase